jgi:hypothetical protein
MNDKLARAAAIVRKHAAFIRLDRERNILIDAVVEVVSDEPGFIEADFRDACQPSMVAG